MSKEAEQARQLCGRPETRIKDFDRFDAKVIAELAHDLNSMPRLWAARAKNADEKTLDQLAKDPNWDIRVAAANHPNTAVKTLTDLNKHLGEEARKHLVHKGFLRSEHYNLAIALAANPKTPRVALTGLYETFCHEASSELVKYLAQHANTPDKILDNIARDFANYLNVVDALSKNPNLSIEAGLTVAQANSSAYGLKIWEVTQARAQQADGKAGLFAVNWAKEQRGTGTYRKTLEHLEDLQDKGAIDDETLTLALALVRRSGTTCEQALNYIRDNLEENPVRKTRTRNKTSQGSIQH